MPENADSGLDTSTSTTGVTSRRRFLTTAGAGAIGLLAGCSGKSGSSSSGQDTTTKRTNTGSKTEYTFTTGPSQSIAFGMASALSSVVRNNSDHVMNVKAATSSQSVALLARGETDFAYATTLVGLRAKNREGSFSQLDFNRTLLQLPSFYFIRVGCYALASSDLQHYSDLAGKPIGPGPSGASYWSPMSVALRKVLSDSEIELKPAGLSQYGSLLSSGRAKAVGGPLNTNGLVPSFMQQVYNEQKVRMLSWSDEAISKIKDDSRITLEQVPNDKLGNSIEEFTATPKTPLIRANYVMYTSEAMPKETVYSLYKTAWENKKALAETHPGFKKWLDASFFTANLTPDIPVHPGAVKFLKELGVWSDKYTVGGQ